MSRENTSSVDMANGKKMAHYASQEKVAMKKEFQGNGEDANQKQVINARKSENLLNAKAKAKRKAKLAKASKKRNKK